MNRTPPKQVRETLRKEVNFGCPAPRCGIPYLTWHHFDPPWSVREHHDPKGMIALCAKHAAFADAGRYTPDQLRQMKMRPFITSDQISESYDYLRRNVVCMIGNVAYKVQNALEINGESVIGFNIDGDGYSRLNLLIRDKDGKPILMMEDNFWTAVRNDLFDLRCSLRGKILGIISKDRETTLSIRFDDYPLAVFKKKMLVCFRKGLKAISSTGMMKETKETLEEMASRIDWFTSEIGSPDFVPTLSIKGRLLWDGVHLKIGSGEIKNLANGSIYGMNLVVGGKTAFSFDEKSMRFGIS